MNAMGIYSWLRGSDRGSLMFGLGYGLGTRGVFLGQ